MPGPRTRSRKAPGPSAPDSVRARRASTPEERQGIEPDFKRLISEEVQKAVTSALAESVAPLLANLSGTPSSQTTAMESAGTGTQLVAFAPNQAHALSVPASLQDRIVRGEFLEFASLLPDVLGAPKRDTIQLQLNGARTVELVEPEAGVPSVRRRIYDLATWFEAWSRFMFVIVSHAPSRFPELMAYQSTILSANGKYFPEAWLAYDREFRRAASLEPTKRWDVIDANMWQLNMTGKSRPPCPSCRTIHPPGSGSCPFRPSRNTGSSQSQFRTETSDGREICRNYNHNRCSIKDCKWAHVCNNCEGSHQRSTCHRLQYSLDRRPKSTQ